MDKNIHAQTLNNKTLETTRMSINTQMSMLGYSHTLYSSNNELPELHATELNKVR